MKIKRLIILIFCLLVWGSVFLYFVTYENDKKQKSVTQFVLINPFNYWEYTNLKWKKVDAILDFDYVDKNINWKKFKIYRGNEYYNTLDFTYRKGEEFFFDDKSNSYDIIGEKILFNEKSYMELLNFNESSFSNDDIVIVQNFLSEYRHSISGITVQKKYIVGTDEYIYIISNYPSGFIADTSSLFYFAFYRNGEKNYLLFDKKYVNNVSSYKLSWNIDIKNKYNNFIFSYQCEEAVCYDMYQFVKGKYVRVIGSLEQ